MSKTYMIFMIVGIIAVGGGWIAYLIWDYKQRKEEASQPKQPTERLQKTRNEVSDWAKKMAEFKSPVPKRPADSESTQSGG